jgi:hypothetical protein
VLAEFPRKLLLREPCQLHRGIPSSPRLRVLTVRCCFFGNRFRGMSRNASSFCGFQEALRCNVNVAFGTVYRVTSNRFAASTAEAFWFEEKPGTGRTRGEKPGREHVKKSILLIFCKLFSN